MHVGLPPGRRQTDRQREREPSRPSYAPQAARGTSSSLLTLGTFSSTVPTLVSQLLSAAIRCAAPHALGAALVRGATHVLLDLHSSMSASESTLRPSFKKLASCSIMALGNSSESPILSSSATVRSPSLDWSLLKEPHGGRLRRR